MIRELQRKDKEMYLSMAKAFYESDAVLENVPRENFEKTFDLLMKGTPFAKGYIFEEKEKILGYALLALTHSQEAGGEVVWIEEIYLLPEERGKGVGKEFFSFLEKEFPSARRFRLEVEKENEKAVSLYKQMGFSFFPYDQMKKDR